MSKRRDRHARGIRGPLARANEVTGAPVPLRKKPPRLEVFRRAVQTSVDQIATACPRALTGMAIGYEDVPGIVPSWQDRAPLARATPARPGEPGHVVLYRRPIEFRAPTPAELRRLVHHTLVEQLSATTGIPCDELDPHFDPDDWDD